MDTDIGKFMTVEDMESLLIALFSELISQRKYSKEVCEVWERKGDQEYSFGEWETESGLGKYNMHVRKQQGPTWRLQSST